MKVEILADAFDDGGLEAGDLMNFVEKIIQRAVERGEEDQLARPVGEIGNGRGRYSRAF